MRGWVIHDEISDNGWSGGTDADTRPGLKRLMQLARSRKIDVIVVVKLDRLFRSLKHLVNTLDDLESLGVMFVSTRDHLDFTTPTGRLTIGILGALSEFERSLIRGRTIAGLAHAKEKGVKLGRPRHGRELEIIKLKAEGLTCKGIQERLHLSKTAVYRALARVPKTP